MRLHKKFKLKHYLFLKRIPPLGGYGGCEKLLLEWLKYIDYRRFKITLAVSRGKKYIFSERIKQNNIPVEIVEFPFDFNNGFLKRFLNMYLLIKKVKANAVIFVQGHFSHFRIADVLAGFIYTHGNVFMTEHSGAPEPPAKNSKRHLGFIPGINLWWYKHMIFYLLRAYFSKKILAVSGKVEETLVKFYGYPRDKIYVVYHGVDMKNFSQDIYVRRHMRNKFNIPNNDMIIVSTARLADEKCLHRVINAFDKLWHKSRNLWLFFVGDGHLKNNLKKLANSKESKNNIKFVGFQEHISNFLKMSDIFVLSSDNEGFSISILEALAAGLISVATKTHGTNEVIKNKQNGFLVNRSENGIFKGLTEALSLSEKERKKISENCRILIENKFNIEKRIKEALNVLELVV